MDYDSTRIIKRYSNRKLYDTSDSRYVTLEQIAAYVRAGETVRVVDNRTGRDLTSATFAHIVYEGERLGRDSVAVESLRSLVRLGSVVEHDSLRTSAATIEQIATEIGMAMGESSDSTLAVRQLRCAVAELLEQVRDIEARIPPVAPAAVSMPAMPAMTSGPALAARRSRTRDEREQVRRSDVYDKETGEPVFEDANSSGSRRA